MEKITVTIVRSHCQISGQTHELMTRAIFVVLPIYLGLS